MKKDKTSLQLSNKDEVELFHSKDFWCESDNLIASVELALAPHSDLYYSPCCALFSYELKSIDSLNLFSSVLLRDGAAFLLDFFLRYPVPNDLRTKVLVHRDLEALVPKAWFQNIELYSIESSLDSVATNKVFVVSYNLLTHGINEKLSNEIELAKSSCEGDFKVLPAFIDDFSNKSKSLLPSAYSNFVSRVSMLGINFINLEETLSLKSQDWTIEQASENLKWVADSYIEQKLLSLGFSKSPSKREAEQLGEIELSLSHRVRVEKFDPLRKEKQREQLWSFVRENKLTSNDNINRIDGGLRDLLNSGILDISEEIILEKSARSNLFKE